MKEDCVWLRDWNDPVLFEENLMRWIDDYNQKFPHQSIGYKTPKSFRLENLKKLTYFSLA